jgi:hypothetical protein
MKTMHKITSEELLDHMAWSGLWTDHPEFDSKLRISISKRQGVSAYKNKLLKSDNPCESNSEEFKDWNSGWDTCNHMEESWKTFFDKELKDDLHDIL